MSGKVRSSDAAEPPLSLVLTGVRVAPATTLTAVIVQNKVASAYFAGVKRCYRSVLAGNPSQPRKLEMSFTVSVNGRMIRPNVTGPAHDLVACVASLVASWRFPIPKDHDGEPLEVQASMTIDAHD
jgi:hypothetical protein